VNHSGLAGRIPLNKFFTWSHFHHLNLKKDPNYGVYVPVKLHRSIAHNSNTGEGIDEVNSLIYQWMVKKYRLNLADLTTPPTDDDFFKLSELIIAKKTKVIEYKRKSGVQPKNKNLGIHLTVPFDSKDGKRMDKKRSKTGLNWNNYVLYKTGLVNLGDIKENRTRNTNREIHKIYTVNLQFSDDHGIKLQKMKNHMGLSWHDFILALTNDKNPGNRKRYI
jgi:hypothetical protein